MTEASREALRNIGKDNPEIIDLLQKYLPLLHCLLTHQLSIVIEIRRQLSSWMQDCCFPSRLLLENGASHLKAWHLNISWMLTPGSSTRMKWRAVPLVNVNPWVSNLLACLGLTEWRGIVLGQINVGGSKSNEVRGISLWSERVYKSLVKRHDQILDCNSIHSIWKFANNVILLTENGPANKQTNKQKRFFFYSLETFIKMGSAAAYILLFTELCLASVPKSGNLFAITWAGTAPHPVPLFQPRWS